MRKQIKVLSLLTSILVGIGSFTGPVYAEGDDETTTASNAQEPALTYNVMQGSETFTLNPANGSASTDQDVTYKFDPDAVEVAIAAWHHWDQGDGKFITDLANNAKFASLTGEKDKEKIFRLQNYWGTSPDVIQGKNTLIQGYLVVVVKAKPGHLITGFRSNGTLGEFYAIQLGADGNFVVPDTPIKTYTGIQDVGTKAAEAGYVALFNYNKDGKHGPQPFEIYSESVKVEPTAQITAINNQSITPGNDLYVNLGDTIEITSRISPSKVTPKYDKDTATLSITGIDNISEEIEGNTNPNFTNATTDKNKDSNGQPDGTYTHIVHYTVQTDDVKRGYIRYVIRPKFNYKYDLKVSNGTVTTIADTDYVEAKVDISTRTNQLIVTGNDVSYQYNGEQYSESGLLINGEPLNAIENANAAINTLSQETKVNAEITVNGGKYRIYGITVTAATAMNVTNPNNLPLVKVKAEKPDFKIELVNADGSLTDATDAFKVITKHGEETTSDGTVGSLTITPASLSIDNIDSPVYNGQNQQLSAVVKGSIDGSPVLGAGQDYDLSYAATNNDYKNAGTTVTVTATGKGNYTGTVSTSYTIQPRPLRVGTNSDSKIYDGKPLTAAGSIDGAVASDHLRLITTGTQTSVGSSQNTYTIDYGNAKGNYKVAGESIGTLTVYAPAAKPSGRTCQQDGYPAGYAWDDAQQACVLRVTSVTPSIKAVPSTGAY